MDYSNNAFKNMKNHNDELNRKFDRGNVRYVFSAETPKQYNDFSERVSYKRRLIMTNKPVIIIYFEGVIGFRNKNWLYLRAGVYKFINRIWPDFQVVLVTNYNSKETMMIKDILIRRGITFDAVYSLNYNTSKCIFAYYDQIYKDFLIR